MRNRLTMGFCLGGFLLMFFNIGALSAVPPEVVGMVTDVQGNAYWQSDSKKKTVQVLAGLPIDATLVLSKGSNLDVVYLTSGQKYELHGPGVVKFKNTQPIALSGPAPKMLDATATSANKNLRINPQDVQTAGQTLVSTEKQTSEAMPVAAAAPPPPPAPSPVQPPTVFADVAASEQARAAEYESMQKMLADQAEAAASSAEMAATSNAQAEEQATGAAYEATGAQDSQSADVQSEDKQPPCPPPSSDAESKQTSTQACSEIKN